MDENKQQQKYMMGLSGEFLVAGELLRRGIRASITFGNSKKADVIAVRGDSAILIEVKTTRQAKWVVGSKVPEPNDAIWIFVLLPLDSKAHPEFFLLTGKKLHAILQPRHEKYVRDHPDFKGPGVESITFQDIESHR